MRSIVFLVIIFCCTSTFLKAQNLVPNPGFDSYTACPTSNSSEVYLASPWVEVEPTADFYACSSLDNSQIARSGDGYMAVSAYRPSWSSTYREYIGTYLQQTLTAGTAYYVEFWVRLSWGHCWSSDGMGAYFSQGPPPPPQGTQSMLYVPAQIMNPPYRSLDDHDNWMKICGTFVSNGTENFITIGSFKDDSQSFFEEVNNCAGGNGVHWSYYHIEDVLVTPYDTNMVVDCGSPGTPPVDPFNPNIPPNPDNPLYSPCSLNLPNVISPNNDGVNDRFDLSMVNFEDYHLKIYNRWGKLIYSATDETIGYWDGYQIIDPVSEGVYFYVFYSYDGLCYQTGTVTVFR